MAEESSIRYIKNWWRYQHYKERRPPWIKLHEGILDDPDIQGLSAKDFKRLITLWLRSRMHDGTIDLGLPNLWQTLGFGQRGACNSLLARLEVKGLITKEDTRGAWEDDASETLNHIHIQKQRQNKIHNRSAKLPKLPPQSEGGGDEPGPSGPKPPVKQNPKPEPLWNQWKGQGSVDGVQEPRIRLCIHYLLSHNDWYKDKLTNFGFIRRMAKRMDDDTPQDYCPPKPVPKEPVPVPDSRCPKCKGTGQLKPRFVRVEGQRSQQIVIPRCDCSREETK